MKLSHGYVVSLESNLIEIKKILKAAAVGLLSNVVFSSN